jgi:glycine cleavage system H protein
LSGLYYTRQHEWIRFINHTAFVGLTGKSLQGDVVYIELPEIGKIVGSGEPCAQVESVKATSSVCAPVKGVISAVNDSVYDDPDIIATHPLSTWLFKVDYEGEAEPEGLLTESEYNEM